MIPIHTSFTIGLWHLSTTSYQKGTVLVYYSIERYVRTVLYGMYKSPDSFLSLSVSGEFRNENQPDNNRESTASVSKRVRRLPTGS